MKKQTMYASRFEDKPEGWVMSMFGYMETLEDKIKGAGKVAIIGLKDAFHTTHLNDALKNEWYFFEKVSKAQNDAEANNMRLGNALTTIYTFYEVAVAIRLGKTVDAFVWDSPKSYARPTHDGRVQKVGILDNNAWHILRGANNQLMPQTNLVEESKKYVATQADSPWIVNEHKNWQGNMRELVSFLDSWTTTFHRDYKKDEVHESFGCSDSSWHFAKPVSNWSRLSFRSSSQRRPTLCQSFVGTFFAQLQSLRSFVIATKW